MRSVLLLILVAGCGAVEPCEGVRDLSTSPAGLTLTAGEHPGWGESACFQCHSVAAFHREVCMRPDVDLDEVNARIDPGDTESCVACHGANGVARWADADGGGP